MVDSYSERLVEAMKARGVSKTQLSQRLGISYQAVKKAVEGGRFGTENHLAAAHILGVRSEWLANGSGSRDAPEPRHAIDPDEFAFVHRADVAFANGVGKVAYHEDEKPPLVFRRDFLRKLGIAEGDAVVVDGIGHSNIPKIPDGSVVLVNKGDRTRLDGDFFAFRASGELLIKRLEKLENIGVLATAENPDFKPKTKVYAAGTDDFEVIGRAVWAGSVL